MKAIFPELFLFFIRVINKMKLMCCTFILKNVINYTDESRTASSVNSYTRNKYIFHAEQNTFFSNIYNTFDDKIFIVFCIKNVICPHVQNINICFDVFFLINVGWILWSECFDVAPPEKWHLQFAVLSRVFKIFIPLGMLSPKITMLSWISDGVLFSL